jgi:hypothetical protein
MSIFTVTDDAFHGHPEPLTSPPGVMRSVFLSVSSTDPSSSRYGFQIVYYTKERGERFSSHNRLKKKRKYAPYHGAIFQPSCPLRGGGSGGGMREFCTQEPRDSDQLRCECNFRE